MANYYAVFKVAGSAMPATLSWESGTVMEAIEYLCKQARVADTTGLAAYEIMEVVGLRNYRSIALKEEVGKINVKRSPVPLEKMEELFTPELEPLTLDEVVYQRYSLSTL